MPAGVPSSERPTVKAPALEKPRRRKRATLSPGDRIGAWRVEGELGRGGMGSVYAVTHAGFGKRAALKLCHLGVLGAEFTIDTFLREARIVHLINHPGVPDVFATGTYDRRPYLAMERLHGQTLGDYLESREVSKTEALDLLFEICCVIAAAHLQGVVHRDLKLDNIFVLDTPPGAPHRIKVLDWGVARVLGEPDPMAGMIAGTLTYVAPEQIRADDLTPAADVYSLGVLAYQLLVGRPPFTATKDIELIRMHLQMPPPAPSHLWPEMPDDLEGLLLAMLAKNPDERPTMEDVLDGIITARRELAPRSESTLSLLRAIPFEPPIDVLGRPAPLRFALLARAIAETPKRIAAAVVALGGIAASIATLFG